MCGIAGVIDWNHKTNTEEIGERMKHVLKRRGPDQDGIHIDGASALIHTRLSVVDLENGKQPMHYRQGKEEYTIVYNGELYNTEELRADLLALGHLFIGHSDTEVLLHAFAQWGAECVNRFNGIFAFAVWEKHQQRLFIARDRIGVKPFFYKIIPNAYVFASELKGLLVHPGIKAEIDANGIAELLIVGPGRTPGCGVFRGIEELPPASCGFYSQDGLKIWTYWRLQDHRHTDTLQQTIEKVRYLVVDAIERQLVSDVPVGTFLSGGLDSSIISTVAERYFRKRSMELNTFSVGYRENEKYFKRSKFQPDSDEQYIKKMTDYLSVRDHNITIDNDALVEALFYSVDARDLPGMADVDASLLLFCKEVKQHVTVALSGECADEIFGGYPWFRDKEIRDRYGFPWAQSTDYRIQFLRPEFAGLVNLHDYVDSRYQATLRGTSIAEGTTGLEKRMREMMKLNLDWFMQTLLDRKDRMSMYHGLEVRVPFCDYRIAAYLYSIPWDMKDCNGREKGLLRMAMRDYLPEDVLWRKKSPYPKTHHPQYLRAVSSLLRERISDPASPLLQLVRKQALEQLLQDDNSIPWYGQLMTTPQTIAYFLQLDYWLKKYKVNIV